jgi:branched-chain amino acid transport system substrate-binding protein
MELMSLGLPSQKGNGSEMKRVWQASLFLSLVMSIACRSGPSDLVAPEMIKIGASVTITGGSASFGGYARYGVTRAIEAANAGGGVFVKRYNRKLPVKLIMYDNESRAEKAAADVERLILRDEVVAITGLTGPERVLSGAEVAERYKVPVVTTGAPLGTMRKARQWNYLWDIFFDEADLCRQQFRLMDTVNSNRKVVLFTDNGPDGTVQGAFWEQYAPQFGYQILYRASFPGGTTDYGDMIRKAQATGAEILIAQIQPPDGIALVRQMEALNWKPKAAFLERACEAADFWTALGKSAQGMCITTIWHPECGYPGGKELVEAFTRETGQSWATHLVNSYAAAQVLLRAIEVAGTLDREAINRAVPEAASSQTTVLGMVKFAADHTAAQPTMVLQWQDGERQLVYPQEKATKSFLYPLPSWRDLRK